MPFIESLLDLQTRMNVADGLSQHLPLGSGDALLETAADLLLRDDFSETSILDAEREIPKELQELFVAALNTMVDRKEIDFDLANATMQLFQITPQHEDTPPVTLQGSLF